MRARWHYATTVGNSAQDNLYWANDQVELFSQAAILGIVDVYVDGVKIRPGPAQWPIGMGEAWTRDLLPGDHSLRIVKNGAVAAWRRWMPSSGDRTLRISGERDL